MEYFLGATSEKISKYIPDDLTFTILSKLPLKSLKRFECVHKSWVLLFKNPQFMSIFCNNSITNNNSYYDDSSLILNECTIGFHLFSGERFEDNFGCPNPFQEEDPNFAVLDSGSITGIICLYQILKGVVLWNPATGEFKIVPPSPIAEPLPLWIYFPVTLHGFGYDHVRDDYKLLRHVKYATYDIFDGSGYNKLRDPLWEIYSLKNNSWRQLDVNVPVCTAIGNYYNQTVYNDGMCHWWGRGESTRQNDESTYLLSSFDLRNDVFYTTPISSDIDDNYDIGLLLLYGSIALISWSQNFTKDTTYHISVLGELGVKESWTKLFTIGPLHYSRCIGAGKSGDIFINRYGYLARYDLNTHQIEEFSVKEVYCYGLGFHLLYKVAHQLCISQFEE